MAPNPGFKKESRWLEFAVLIAVVALVASWLKPKAEESAEVKSLSPQQIAAIDEFFAEARSQGRAVLQDAPVAMMREMRDSHPYEAYKELKATKQKIDRLTEVIDEIDALNDEWLADCVPECENEELCSHLAEWNERREVLEREFNEALERITSD